MDNIVTDTSCGKIRGIINDSIIEYRGIKYATANRWEYPKQVKKWDGEYDATKFGACSYQRRGFEDDAVCNAFFHKEFRQGMSFEYSEDCLFLNIWSPKNPKNCPVIIFIHGGSFTGGCAHENHICGDVFAKNGIIFVGMNYRLGPYGFCSHPDIAIDGVCGNFGIFDQYIAIKWVKENIEAFGGDPNNITLSGQSAGAMSTDIQLSNPKCKGWFSGAVMMSGGGIQRKVARPLAPEKTKAFWETIMKNANTSSMEELRKVDAETLYYAWLKACDDDIKSMLYTLPVYDNEIVTKENFNMATIPDIPYILGVTVTDMVPVALEGITKAWCNSTKKHKSKTYVYNFTRELPGDNNGAWHTCDLLYIFSTLEKNWRPFTRVDYEISNQMTKMMCAFAKTGDPNCNAIPSKWVAGFSKPMHFCENTKSAPWPKGKLAVNTFIKRGPF